MSAEGLPAAAHLFRKCWLRFGVMVLWFGCNAHIPQTCPQDGASGRYSSPLRGGSLEFLSSFRAHFTGHCRILISQSLSASWLKM